MKGNPSTKVRLSSTTKGSPFRIALQQGFGEPSTEFEGTLLGREADLLVSPAQHFEGLGIPNKTYSLVGAGVISADYVITHQAWNAAARTDLSAVLVALIAAVAASDKDAVAVSFISNLIHNNCVRLLALDLAVDDKLVCPVQELLQVQQRICSAWSP